MSSAVENPPDQQDDLVIRHFALMRAYSFTITHTALPPYSFWIAGEFPAFEQLRPSGVAIRNVLALCTLLFSVNGLSIWLMTVVTKVELYFPSAMRGQVRDLGSTLSFFTSVIAFTLFGLNYYLADPTARGIIVWSSPDSSNLLKKRIIRPLVTRMGARFIRQHLRSRLDKLICLYRARIATGTLTKEQKTSLQEATDETAKLRDSLPPEWQLMDILRYPAVAAGLLVLLGFMHGQSISPSLSILIGCFLFAPYILARRIKHIALEWEIPIDTPLSPEQTLHTASIYALESQLFKALGCSGLPKLDRLDVILQIFAGIVGTISCLVFAFQFFGPLSKTGLAFWGAMDLAIFWFFVYKPVQELRARTDRYNPQRAPVPRLERFLTVVTPESSHKYVFLGSLSVLLLESVFALYKEGLSFTSQLPMVFAVWSQTFERSVSHLPNSSVKMPEIHLTIEQAHLALFLFKVWFGVTALLFVLDLIYSAVIYPTLRNPDVHKFMDDLILDSKDAFTLIRQQLSNRKRG